MRVAMNHLPSLMFAVLATSLPTALAFVPTSRPYRIRPSESSTIRTTSTFQRVPDHAHQYGTLLSRLSALVAHEKEEKHKKKKDDESSWIQTVGGFIPVLPGLNKKLQKQSKKEQRELITVVTTIKDYKRVVADEKEQIVCVRFYAPWCRACRAVEAPFRRLASEYKDVKLVEVPLTQDNAFLHEGLGVPSLPFGHIYHPQAGLVEERSINKKIFKEFKDTLQTYVAAECPIDWDERRIDGVED